MRYQPYIQQLQAGHNQTTEENPQTMLSKEIHQTNSHSSCRRPKLIFQNILDVPCITDDQYAHDLQQNLLKFLYFYYAPHLPFP